MALGVQYLHSHDILHKDIKTANFLLSADFTVRICDFGTAEQIEQERESDFELSPEVKVVDTDVNVLDTDEQVLSNMADSLLLKSCHKAFSSLIKKSHVTEQTERPTGTPYYLAPEIW